MRAGHINDPNGPAPITLGEKQWRPGFDDFAPSSAENARENDDVGEDVEGGTRWVFAGTPAYQPPEAYRGKAPSTAFDLWALAVTMLEAITGVSPFASSDRDRTIQLIKEYGLSRQDQPGVSNPDCPSDLRAFFERALAHRPELRFETALEFESALQSCEPEQSTAQAMDPSATR